MFISLVSYPYQHESMSPAVQELPSCFPGQETEADCQRFRPGSWAAKASAWFPPSGHPATVAMDSQLGCLFSILGERCPRGWVSCPQKPFL